MFISLLSWAIRLRRWGHEALGLGCPQRGLPPSPCPKVMGLPQNSHCSQQSWMGEGGPPRILQPAREPGPAQGFLSGTGIRVMLMCMDCEATESALASEGSLSVTHAGIYAKRSWRTCAWNDRKSIQGPKFSQSFIMHVYFIIFKRQHCLARNFFLVTKVINYRRFRKIERAQKGEMLPWNYNAITQIFSVDLLENFLWFYFVQKCIL